jgi:hypothetical protein
VGMWLGSRLYIIKNLVEFKRLQSELKELVYILHLWHKPQIQIEHLLELLEVALTQDMDILRHVHVW